MEENVINFSKQVVEQLLQGEDKNKEARLVSPLLLAYVGDSIYDLIIRTMLIKEGNRQINKINHQATKYVSAVGQSRVIELIENDLTDEEKDIYRRGRNAKSHTKAKNADIKEYKESTGFETLIGYLYLKNDLERIFEISKKAVAIIDEGKLEKAQI